MHNRADKDVARVSSLDTDLMELVDNLDRKLDRYEEQVKRLEVKRAKLRAVESIEEALEGLVGEPTEPIPDRQDLRDTKCPVDDEYLRALERANIWEKRDLRMTIEESAKPERKLRKIPGIDDEAIDQIDDWWGLKDAKKLVEPAQAAETAVLQPWMNGGARDGFTIHPDRESRDAFIENRLPFDVDERRPRTNGLREVRVREPVVDSIDGNGKLASGIRVYDPDLDTIFEVGSMLTEV